MRYRRRLKARAKNRYYRIMKRWSARVEVLKRGIGEAIKEVYDREELKNLLDVIATDLVPAMKEEDRYFNLAYPPKHRRNPSKKLSKAKKRKPS